MSQVTNNTTYNFNGQANGTTAGGTGWAAILILQAVVAPGSTDFTDETSFTLQNALITALASVGWSATPADITLSKTVFDDTLTQADPSTNTFK
jgi:hypothetical protein